MDAGCNGYVDAPGTLVGEEPVKADDAGPVYCPVLNGFVKVDPVNGFVKLDPENNGAVLALVEVLPGL
jgi:hypothetical protein